MQIESYSKREVGPGIKFLLLTQFLQGRRDVDEEVEERRLLCSGETRSWPKFPLLFNRGWGMGDGRWRA